MPGRTLEVSFIARRCWDKLMLFYAARTLSAARRRVAASIETEAQASHRAAQNICRLGGHLPDLAEAVHACHEPLLCEQIVCAKDARLYRSWFGAALLLIAREFQHVTVLTIDLMLVDAGELHTVDIAREHDRLRKRLVRSGFAEVMGGTEVSWNYRSRRWKFHLHLLIFGPCDEAIEQLREACRHDGMRRQIRLQPLKNPLRQITYLQKFVTAYRAGIARRLYPLPSKAHAELAAWWAQYRFQDFLFLLGFRRRGARIERIADGRVINP